MDSPAGAVGYVSMVAAMTSAAVEGVEAVTDVERAAVSSGILGGMAAPRTEKSGGKVVLKNPTKKPPREPEGRKKSVFTRVGDEAKAAAQRELLLKTLKANAWNLTATAEELEMGAIAAVIRALRELAPDEYEKARDDGKVSQGNRRT